MKQKLRLLALILSAIMLLGGLMGCVKLEETNAMPKTDAGYKIELGKVGQILFITNYASSMLHHIEGSSEEVLQAKEKIVSFFDTNVEFVETGTTLEEEWKKSLEGSKYNFLDCPHLTVFTGGNENGIYYKMQFHIFDGKLFKSMDPLVFDEETGKFVTYEEGTKMLFESVEFNYTEDDVIAFLEEAFGEPIIGIRRLKND